MPAQSQAHKKVKHTSIRLRMFGDGATINYAPPSTLRFCSDSAPTNVPFLCSYARPPLLCNCSVDCWCPCLSPLPLSSNR